MKAPQCNDCAYYPKRAECRENHLPTVCTDFASKVIEIITCGHCEYASDILLALSDDYSIPALYCTVSKDVTSSQNHCKKATVRRGDTDVLDKEFISV